jgi:hypothetical protein
LLPLRFGRPASRFFGRLVLAGSKILLAFPFFPCPLAFFLPFLSAKQSHSTCNGAKNQRRRQKSILRAFTHVRQNEPLSIVTT